MSGCGSIDNKVCRRLEALRERQAEVVAEEKQAAEDYMETAREQVVRKRARETALDGESEALLARLTKQVW